jgi:ferric-dicitrate binding protein FerR (iron transport regulator)
MTQNPQHKRSRVITLTSLLLDGDISHQEVCELNSLLRDDPQAIEEYASFADIHILLSVTEHNAAHASADGAVVAPAREAMCIAAQRPLRANSGSRQRIIRASIVTVVAASLIIAAMLSLRNVNARSGGGVARIVKEDNPVWNVQSENVADLNRLYIGQEIQLKSGGLLIEFENGAQVALDAPTCFQLLAQDRCLLSAGRLTASVPLQARGFTVETSLVEIVDLGTKFGVIVTDHQGVEAHVFEGRVRVAGRAKGPNFQDTVLSSGKALQISAKSENYLRIAADRGKFSRAFLVGDTAETLIEPRILSPVQP